LFSVPIISFVLLIIFQFFSLHAQVSSDAYQPFGEGEIVGFPGVTQYLGDLPPEIRRLPDEREFHSLVGEGAELPGWDFFNTQAKSGIGYFSRSPGLFFDDIPNPFGAAPFVPKIPGGWSTLWFDMPSAAWWGPMGAGGALVIQKNEFTDETKGRFSSGISGDISENGFFEMNNSDIAFSGSLRQNSTNRDISSFPSYGIQGVILPFHDSSYVFSLSALALQEAQDIYWTVFTPKLNWDDGQWLTMSLNPFLALTGYGDQKVQEGGGLLNGRLNLAGLAESQWGFGYNFQDWSMDSRSNPVQKAYIQNSEWVDAIGILLAHGAFRVDFSNDSSTQFNWLAGLKMIRDDLNLFLESSKSVETEGDVLQWEAGLGWQSAERWNWILEYLNLQFSSENEKGGRVQGKINFPFSIRSPINSLSLRLDGEVLQDQTGNWSSDSGVEFDFLFWGKSRIWILSRKPAGSDWFWEAGGEWRFQKVLGVYAYLSQGGVGENSWPDTGLSTPTSGGLGLRGEF
jgi:hypothetical protein